MVVERSLAAMRDSARDREQPWLSDGRPWMATDHRLLPYRSYAQAAHEFEHGAPMAPPKRQETSRAGIFFRPDNVYGVPTADVVPVSNDYV